MKQTRGFQRWRKNTAPDNRFLLVFFLLLLFSCGTLTGDTEELVSSYAASAAWKFQNTGTFILRGRARLQGENQVFSGPFIVLASLPQGILRGDFCGPDGSPLVSLRADSTGFLFYYPDQGRACFQPRGFPLNTGFLSVNAVISMIRTGFPAEPVPWQMAEMHEELDGGGALWRFTSTGADTMNVVLLHGSLFPSVESGDTRIEITATSWHDSFAAWPAEWLLASPSANLVARLRSMDNEEITDDSRWELIVPVPVDTLVYACGEWKYSRIPSVR